MHTPPFDPSTLLPWSKFNNIDFHDLTTILHLGGERGYGIVASQEISGPAFSVEAQDRQQSKEGRRHYEPKTLLTVPKDLVLSLGLVEEHAKVDRHLREILSGVGDFGKTPRGAILIFLLLQQTHLHTTSTSSPIGVTHPLTLYVSSLLPTPVPLPTFYSSSEQEILYGTTLEDALSQKLSSLEAEFENLRSSTEDIEWCRNLWWDEDLSTSGESLTFPDWLRLDSLYRSRALDLPGTGHAMVPCVDMANHSSGTGTTALYETDANGNAVLQFLDHHDDGSRRVVREGEEITISYGDEKGACEMIYSYGFLEEGMQSANQLFLDLDMQEDDPLAIPKKRVCGCAPGVRIFRKTTKSKDASDPNVITTTTAEKEEHDDEDDGDISFESPYLPWIILNQEDGLDFTVTLSQPSPSAVGSEGASGDLSESASSPIRTLQPLWDSQPLIPSQLPQSMRESSLHPIFELRSHSILQSRVREQLEKLRVSEEAFEECKGTPGIRGEVWEMVKRLRGLERGMLKEADDVLGVRIQRALQRDDVQRYLRGGGEEEAAEEEEDKGEAQGKSEVGDGEEEEDFS